MPDGENQENQKPPQQPPKKSLKDFFNREPVESLITEPDPNYVPGSTPKLTPEQAQEAQVVFFQEAAKRLAKEEVEIADLAIEYKNKFPQPPINWPDSGIYVSETPDTPHIIFVPTEEIQGYPNSKETIIIFRINSNLYSGISAYFGIDSPYELEIPIYADKGTRDEYLEYLRPISAKGFGPGWLFTRYYFDENGNFGKMQGTNSEFQIDKQTLWDNGKSKGFVSEMNPEDFELAGRALGLIKEKLMGALGRAPDSGQKAI